MKKKIVIISVIIVIVILSLFIIFNNKKKKTFDINDPDFNLGEAISGILFNSNVINFSDNSMASKNVQTAIDELYQAYEDGCAIGYEKGTDTGDTYTCNKRSPDSDQSIFFDAGYVNYDNLISGLESENVSNAIIELAEMIPECKQYFSKENITSNSYDCTRPYYTINYIDNLFVGRSQESNDVTAVYTENGSYLTLDGLSATKFFINPLWNWDRRTFEEGDEYEITIKYVSGSYTRKKSAASTEQPLFYFELTNDGELFSDRTTEPKSFVTLAMPLEGEVSTTYTVPASRAGANGLQYRLYQATASNISFSSYKVQIIITKVHSQQVGYGLEYGTLDESVKRGFTFKGWYTGLFDGNEVKSTSINTVPSDQTIYAHYYYHKLHVKYKSWCNSVISWCGTNSKYSMDSKCYALKNGNREFATYGYGQYAGYSAGLANWNNANTICFYRSGQNGVKASGEEWKSVVTGTTYSQSTIYTAAKLATDEGCSLLNTDDCAITLQVNWMSGSSGTSSGSSCCPSGGTYSGGYCYDDPQSGINVASCHSLGLYWVSSMCYNVRYSNSC